MEAFFFYFAFKREQSDHLHSFDSEDHDPLILSITFCVPTTSPHWARTSAVIIKLFLYRLWRQPQSWKRAICKFWRCTNVAWAILIKCDPLKSTSSRVSPWLRKNPGLIWVILFGPLAEKSFNERALTSKSLSRLSKFTIASRNKYFNFLRSQKVSLVKTFVLVRLLT